MLANDSVWVCLNLLTSRVCRPLFHVEENAVINFDLVLKTHLESKDLCNEDETISREKRQLPTTVKLETRFQRKQCFATIYLNGPLIIFCLNGRMFGLGAPMTFINTSFPLRSSNSLIAFRFSALIQFNILISSKPDNDALNCHVFFFCAVYLYKTFLCSSVV